MLNGLFDIDNRLDYLTENGDMLPRLKELVPWEKFRRDLEVIYDHERKSNAGRRPFDVVMMFKILILQSLYNLSDDEMEYQIMDRLSFMRFLDMALDSRVPDAIAPNCAKPFASGSFWQNGKNKKIPLGKNLLIRYIHGHPNLVKVLSFLSPTLEKVSIVC